MDKTLSQKLQEKLDLLEEKKGNGHPYLKGIGSATLLGAGVGGLGAPGLLKGAAAGFRAGSIAALLILGASGIAQVMRKAKEKGAGETKQAIRNAVYHAQKNPKLTNTQKAAIRANGQAAIAKIDQAFKNQHKHESFEGHGKDCDCEECKKAKQQNESEIDTEYVVEDPEQGEDKCESLGKSIIKKLDRIIEEDDAAKKATAAGAIGGAVAGHHIVKQHRRKNVAKALNARNNARNAVKTAAANTKQAVNKSGAAKTILNKETRLAGQLTKKNPTGIIDKLRNGAAKIAQKGRVKAAAQNIKTHPQVAKSLTKLDKANAHYQHAAQGLKDAKSSLRKVGKLTGTGRGALVGGALAAGAYGLHKLVNKNK